MSHNEVRRMVADVVSAYLRNNAVPVSQIPEVIQTVHGSLARLEAPEAAVARRAPKPAVAVRRSVTRDYVVCLEDGKKFKALRRHLQTAHKMTPDEYRAKWGLRADYPMVAPRYAALRSFLAKKMGLGRKPKRVVRGKGARKTVQQRRVQKAA